MNHTVFVQVSLICVRSEFIISKFQAVIDGDLCEQFVLMDLTKQKVVGEELGKTISEVRDEKEGKGSKRLKFKIKNNFL